MPFEQYGEFDPSNLSIETIYRFAELEVNQGLKVMSQIYRNYPDAYHLAHKFIFEQLFYYSERTSETAEKWETACAQHFFRVPQKRELINYFLYNGQSYNVIRKLIGASPNTISKYRFQPPPFYLPFFDGWNGEMLQRWNNIKDHLNLWDQPLAHTQKENLK